jgi:EPTP domain
MSPDDAVAAHSPARLAERGRLPASGARAIAPFRLDGRAYLAIPQLAYDAPGSPPGMNGGDSDTDLLLLRFDGSGWGPAGALPAPGGEDAEFFTIGGRAFLAVASVRSGAGPYSYTVGSVVHEWNGDRFEPFQRFPTFAAKQWTHFTLEDRHFLALAQGVWLPHTRGETRPSVIYEWDGTRFVELQTIPSKWAYNWHPLELDGGFYLAHADHVDPSVLYRWDGARFVPHQDLIEKCGRAFAHFTAGGSGGTGGTVYLACAAIEQVPSTIQRWDGDRFVAHQTLDGDGGREFAVIEQTDAIYVIRVNFITGGREHPKPDLRSQLYRWEHGRLAVIEEFATFGGTDCAVFEVGGETLVGVSNSLTADIHFATESVLYALV